MYVIHNDKQCFSYWQNNIYDNIYDQRITNECQHLPEHWATIRNSVVGFNHHKRLLNESTMYNNIPYRSIVWGELWYYIFLYHQDF